MKEKLKKVGQDFMANVTVGNVLFVVACAIVVVPLAVWGLKKIKPAKTALEALPKV